jgi:hypothetical protein
MRNCDIKRSHTTVKILKLINIIMGLTHGLYGRENKCIYNFGREASVRVALGKLR